MHACKPKSEEYKGRLNWCRGWHCWRNNRCRLAITSLHHTRYAYAYTPTMATECRRIALADPHHLAPPRFLVGGQPAHMLSGDVKLYEWDRDVSLVRIPSSMRSAMPVSAAGKDVHARPADRDRPDQSTRLVALASPQTSRRNRSFHRQDTPPQPLPVHPVSSRRRPPSVGPRHCRPHSQAYSGRDKHILFPARRQLSRYRSRTASV